MSKPTLQYTPISEIPKIRETLKAGFASGKLRSIEYRKNQLVQLAYLLKENNTELEKALGADLGRHALEASLLELNGTLGEVVEAINHVDKWAKPEGVPFNIMFSAMNPTIYKVPKGVGLIIGPFNYPITCSIAILAGAIAAGCPCVVKMSELTPTVSGLIAELFPKYMDPELYRIVNGGIAETTALLDLRWDHIVFTGSTTVGKVVAAAAAKHLTPVTLELGGQCPVFVDPRVDLEHAARRLLWAKVTNAGQTCLAPNHVFVPAESQDALVKAISKVYASFYPEGPAKGQAVSRIVSDRHFDRLKGIIEKTNGEIVLGGETDAAGKYIAPTVVKDVKLDDELMKAELFGPILPIVPVQDIQDAIDYTNSRDHPLALYILSDDAKLKKRVMENTLSGSVGINDLTVQMAVPGLPFGGTGPSGSGYHTGKYSFDIFTHTRSTIDSPRWIDLFFNFRFPPYTASKYKKATMTRPRIPYARPAPGEMGVTGRGWLSWVRRPFLVALGTVIFILTLRYGFGFGLPAWLFVRS